MSNNQILKPASEFTTRELVIDLAVNTVIRGLLFRSLVKAVKAERPAKAVVLTAMLHRNSGEKARAIEKVEEALARMQRWTEAKAAPTAEEFEEMAENVDGEHAGLIHLLGRDAYNTSIDMFGPPPQGLVDMANSVMISGGSIEDGPLSGALSIIMDALGKQQAEPEADQEDEVCQMGCCVDEEVEPDTMPNYDPEPGRAES